MCCLNAREEKAAMPTNITTERISGIEVTAIVEHCLAHGDEPLPQGVLACATSDQLARVAQNARRRRLPR